MARVLLDYRQVPNANLLKTISWSCVALVAMCALGCAGREEPARAAPAPVAVARGSAAPDFTARGIDGETITLSNHLGKKVVLLNFCSSWCEPCVAEFPHLRALYDANKAKGLVILAISVDGPDTAAGVPGFARRNQLNFPMLLDTDSQIASRYNPAKTAPAMVLIDRSGRVVAMREGFTAGDEHALAAVVAAALDAKN